MTEGWNVVQTYPQALGLAVTNFKRQGFDYYSPRCRDRVSRGGRIRWQVGQLFTNYVFVRGHNRWRSLLSTFGVCRLLMSESERPAVVPESFVADLMCRTNEEGLVVLAKSKFSVGQTLELRCGGTSSLVLFDGQKSRDRVFVLMNMLGSLRRTEVDESSLFVPQ